MTLAIIIAYLVVVFAIGPLSTLVARRGSREDFFLAARTIGPFLLLLSLFGTHMSAFSLIGSTGKAYLSGIGTYGLMASSSALIAPLMFLFVGTRVWKIGKDHGYVTQCQYYRERWDSDLVGLVIFVLLVVLVIPYLLIGVMGGGIVLHNITAGPPESGDLGISRGLGSLLVVGVVMGYVFIGGLRGTAWANAFQTLVFMTIGVVSFVAIVNHMGGHGAFIDNLRLLATSVAQKVPDRLDREAMNPWLFFSYMLIPLSVATFPHINMHWLTAKSVGTFKTAIIFYPICMLCVWLPMVLLGTFAAAQLSLTPDKANAVLIVLIKQVPGYLLPGLLGAGVLAAVMSSLDSQSLALSEMFTTDIVVHYGGEARFSETAQIWLARGFVTAILLITWLISLSEPGLVFTIGTWCFAGFTALLPVTIAALFWPRSTSWGVLASVSSIAALGAYLLIDCYVPGTGLQTADVYQPFGLPVHPVAILLPCAAVALVVVSVATSRPRDEVLARFFPRSPVGTAR